MTTDHDPHGPRGDELAEDADIGTDTTPDQLAEDSPRGDGLSDEAGGASPAPDELAEDSPRGDGLAEDA